MFSHVVICKLMHDGPGFMYMTTLKCSYVSNILPVVCVGVSLDLST